MYGVDLHQLVHEKRVVLALDLIDGLPSTSRFRQALLNDPEVAAELVDAEEARERAGQPPGDWEPSVSENSPEVIMMGRMIALLGDLVNVTISQASQGKQKGRQIKVPTPTTAVDAEREKRSRQKSSMLTSIFLPHETE